ncbi:MAG: metallophosphoesterase, partial [Candidatus Omnitrophica bacterium]|nr:metallophosphoesterase [Candidatus Omnitrophota bacterium]
MGKIKILAIGDIHYSTTLSETDSRKTRYGIELLKRVIRRGTCEESPDIVFILGDILDKPDEMEILTEIRKIIDKTDIPCVFIPGNHDGGYERFFNTLKEKPGPHIFKDIIIYSFADTYGEGDICTRSKQDIERFISSVKKHPDKKVIVLQHNPVYPLIESPYPYNLCNAENVHLSYRESNVFLSLSAHYHPGQELICKDGVYYLTVPALCEAPFGYLLIEIEGKNIKVKREYLKNPLPLCDNHCHTQFAYCAEDITIEKILERTELFDTGYVAFTEHADQLYLTEEEYSKALSFYQPDILQRKREEGKDRMSMFKQAVNKVKSERVRIGLEVIPDKDGGISLLPEDREGLDIIVGAIHFFPEEVISASPAKRALWFMDMVEALMKNNVDVLAHPFRVFLRNGLPVPETLFRPVVDILKSYKVV